MSFFFFFFGRDVFMWVVGWMGLLWGLCLFGGLWALGFGLCGMLELKLVNIFLLHVLIAFPLIKVAIKIKQYFYFRGH